MATKKEFSIEFQMEKKKKNDQRKLQMVTIKPTFIRNSLPIYQNAFLVQEEDILTKRKRKEQFDSELLMVWGNQKAPR